MARDWPGLDGRDMVKEVSCQQPYDWSEDAGMAWVNNMPDQGAGHIVIYDFGAKQNIMRHLASWAGRVTVVPATTGAAETLALKPDGIMLSNGPGDPAGLPYAVETVRTLLNSRIPMFGICLGHQLIGRALGGGHPAAQIWSPWG